MRFAAFLLVCAVCFCWGAGAQERPYLNEGKLPHNYQSDYDSWTPEIWAQNRGSAKGVIDDFYAANILHEVFERGGAPYVSVGLPFMRLSQRDRRRAAEFIDYYYGFTRTGAGAGYFLVLDIDDDTVFGEYSSGGLQLQ